MSATQPSISVIVRTSGRSFLFLRRALNSIVAQTLPPALIIVVNDGTNFSGVEVELGKIDLQGIPFKHLPRDPSVHPQPNRAVALNRGVAEANTRWISFLDDDDTWAPEFLKRIAPVLSEGESSVRFGGVVTQTLAVYERLESDKIAEKSRKPFNPGLKSIDLATLAVGNRFTINAMVFRREVFASVGQYREDLPVLEDWEFNVRAAARFHFEVVPYPLACYHIRPSADPSPNSSVDQHKKVAMRIRNEWLQADLAAGRLGFGQLALSGEIRGMGAVLDYAQGWRDRIGRWFGRSPR